MRLLNRGEASIILPAKDVQVGGVKTANEVTKEMRIAPNSEVEVSDAVGSRLLKMYPKVFMRLDRPASTKKKKVKK